MLLLLRLHPFWTVFRHLERQHPRRNLLVRAAPKGQWFAIGLLLVFGHFLVPFLTLLRIDVKLVFRFMLPLCLWVGLMQYADLSFNITPVLHPDGFPWRWLWLDAGCIAFMGGVLASVFLRDLRRYPL
ncbi:MAG TPA: hypothetical protein VN578_20430, partial [Candidatus Binatia bacterium]|nr:hypothetical protein [Candidatus Binatia bacterium]